MAASKDYYILTPCKTDRAYKLCLKGTTPSLNEIMVKLKSKLGCSVLVETGSLTVVKVSQALISIHPNGEMLIRDVISINEAEGIAKQVAWALRES